MYSCMGNQTRQQLHQTTKNILWQQFFVFLETEISRILIFHCLWPWERKELNFCINYGTETCTTMIASCQEGSTTINEKTVRISVFNSLKNFPEKICSMRFLLLIWVHEKIRWWWTIFLTVRDMFAQKSEEFTLIPLLIYFFRVWWMKRLAN